MATLGQWLRGKFTPPSLQEVEAQTRQWEIACKTCGASKDLWEAGGVRYRAVGTKSVLGRCSGCGDKLRIMKIYRRTDAAGS